jgi:hypothetical protein
MAEGDVVDKEHLSQFTALGTDTIQDKDIMYLVRMNSSGNIPNEDDTSPDRRVFMEQLKEYFGEPLTAGIWTMGSKEDPIQMFDLIGENRFHLNPIKFQTTPYEKTTYGTNTITMEEQYASGVYSTSEITLNQMRSGIKSVFSYAGLTIKDQQDVLLLNITATEITLSGSSGDSFFAKKQTQLIDYQKDFREWGSIPIGGVFCEQALQIRGQEVGGCVITPEGFFSTYSGYQGMRTPYGWFWYDLWRTHQFVARLEAETTTERLLNVVNQQIYEAIVQHWKKTSNVLSVTDSTSWVVRVPELQINDEHRNTNAMNTNLMWDGVKIYWGYANGNQMNKVFWPRILDAANGFFDRYYTTTGLSLGVQSNAGGSQINQGAIQCSKIYIQNQELSPNAIPSFLAPKGSGSLTIPFNGSMRGTVTQNNTLFQLAHTATDGIVCGNGDSNMYNRSLNISASIHTLFLHISLGDTSNNTSNNAFWRFWLHPETKHPFRIIEDFADTQDASPFYLQTGVSAGIIPHRRTSILPLRTILIIPTGRTLNSSSAGGYCSEFIIQEEATGITTGNSQTGITFNRRM